MLTLLALPSVAESALPRTDSSLAALMLIRTETGMDTLSDKLPPADPVQFRVYTNETLCVIVERPIADAALVEDRMLSAKAETKDELKFKVSFTNTSTPVAVAFSVLLTLRH